MRQIALPLAARSCGPARIVLGGANAHIAAALAEPANWPFHTAVLTGPARSGKSLFARWFASTHAAYVADDAHRLEEEEIFHRWNLAQEKRRPLLLVAGEPPWTIRLPDLASRLAGSLQLEVGPLDDRMASELLSSLADERGLLLGEGAADYIVPRAVRSYAGLERLAAEIDRLSLERKAAPGMAIWRAALEAMHGPEEPRLL